MDAADILVNRYIVVIQYDENVTAARSGIVESLQGKASGQSTVPYHGNGLVIATLKPGSIGIAEGG